MENDYLEVLNKIAEEELKAHSKEEIDDIKFIIKSLIDAEKNYEFNNERPRIKNLLDSLIHG